MNVTWTENTATGASSGKISLTAEEVRAMKQAHRILRERADKENFLYDPDAAEWSFLGVLRETDVDGLLQYAKNAPLSKPKREYHIGHINIVEDPRVDLSRLRGE